MKEEKGERTMTDECPRRHVVRGKGRRKGEREMDNITGPEERKEKEREVKEEDGRGN